MMLQAFANASDNNPSTAEDGSPTKPQAGSPVKGVFQAAMKKRVSQEPLNPHKHHNNKTPVSESKSNIIPKTIEDVPFRRQDRRILNARKKRVINR